MLRFHNRFLRQKRTNRRALMKGHPARFVQSDLDLPCPHGPKTESHSALKWLEEKIVRENENVVITCIFPFSHKISNLLHLC